MKNNNITALLAKFLGTYDKQDAKLDEQDEKITDLSSKFSTYEDHLERMILKNAATNLDTPGQR